MFVDSHCHLYFEQLRNNVDQIIENAKKEGVSALLNIATKKSEFEENLSLIEPYDFIFQAVGTHPHNAADDQETSPLPLVQLVEQNDKIVAIGETGLDFHYNHSPKEQQEKQFRRHIEAAREAKVPVIIHTRSAEEDTLRVLKDEYIKGHFDLVIHCFSGTEKLAFECLELGAYLSFSGIITFKSTLELQSICKNIPMQRMLIETDAPYLAPVPHRGKDNQPAFVRHTAQKIADIRGLSLQEVGNITTHNFYQLFKKAAPLPS